MSAALAPVIGHGGVAALFNRTIHIATAQRPWLADVHETSLSGPLPSLREALIAQGSTAAAEAHDAMMSILLDLLSRLVGPSLTDRLLQPVWPSLSAGDAVQDNQ